MFFPALADGTPGRDSEKYPPKRDYILIATLMLFAPYSLYIFIGNMVVYFTIHIVQYITTAVLRLYMVVYFTTMYTAVFYYFFIVQYTTTAVLRHIHCTYSL